MIHGCVRFNEDHGGMNVNLFAAHATQAGDGDRGSEAGAARPSSCRPASVVLLPQAWHGGQVQDTGVEWILRRRHEKSSTKQVS